MRAEPFRLLGVDPAAPGTEIDLAYNRSQRSLPEKALADAFSVLRIRPAACAELSYPVIALLNSSTLFTLGPPRSKRSARSNGFCQNEATASRSRPSKRQLPGRSHCWRAALLES